nr:hypothetical protein [Komagataeibacter xylinus]
MLHARERDFKAFRAFRPKADAQVPFSGRAIKAACLNHHAFAFKQGIGKGLGGLPGA